MTTVDDEDFILRSNEYQINKTTLTMHLYAEHNLNTILNIKEILYNNVEICKGKIKSIEQIHAISRDYFGLSKFFKNSFDFGFYMQNKGGSTGFNFSIARTISVDSHGSNFKNEKIAFNY